MRGPGRDDPPLKGNRLGCALPSAGREAARIRQDDVAALLAGKAVLVTGGAGTIGSERCRQVARFRPARLVVLDVDETRLHDLVLELREQNPGLDVADALVDVRRPAELERAFREHRPAVVFHAAAYKHVPVMERWPLAALETNVLGTQQVAAAARAAGCGRFVLVSTDKAVNPTNVMGASKRLAEMAVFAEPGGGMVRSAVRFGNVIGSRGSVIPTFERQLRQGGPLTVTHPEIERYFMVTSEAVALVLQAAALGRGHDVFVLEMGKPVRILDVAREFCRLNGYEPGVDVQIAFTGLRPGEKMYEELSYAHEKLGPTAHPQVLRADVPADAGAGRVAEAVRAVVREGDPEQAVALLRKLFPSMAGAPAQPAARPR